MNQVISYFKKRPHLLILGLILLIGLFFRSYQIVERFEFAHDGDLYSWIVKDIVVNHHFRLIGQLTSAHGIFIGGLFYYLLIPFFLITKMDPIGTIYFALIIGLSTIFSIYFVMSKLFKSEIGLIAAFLYATLLTTVNADRWVVPTITINLWVIWYFYTIVKITRGDYKVLPLLGLFIALIWHTHIALIPTLIAIPAAIYFAKKLPGRKQVIQFFIVFFLANLPLFIFELRHRFIQTLSLTINFTAHREGAATGFYKLTQVLDMIAKNTNVLLFTPQSLNLFNGISIIVIIILAGFWLVKKKLLQQKELIVLFSWIAGVIAFFGFSSSPISEYYFSNINMIFLILISLLLYLLFKSSFLGKIFILGLLIVIAIKNGYFIVTQDYYNKGYVEKKKVVNFIKTDAASKNYPCIGISYITKIGENVGFRYLLYLDKINTVPPSFDVPVYNIFIPEESSRDSTKQVFGHIAVVPPDYIPPKEVIQKTCQTPNTNLTDPMFGYVD